MGTKGTRFGTGSEGAAMLQQALRCDAAGRLALLRAVPSQGRLPWHRSGQGASAGALSLPSVFMRPKKLNRAEVG